MPRGFTLIELLVVLIIIGIAGGGIALALDRAQAGDSEREVERLRRALEHAAYRAALRGRPLAVDLLSDGYRFSERQPDGGWQRLEAPPELAPRRFSSNLRLSALHLGETSTPSLASKHEDGGGARRIIFGTRAPVFLLALDADHQRYRLAGRIDGRVEHSLLTAQDGR